MTPLPSLYLLSPALILAYGLVFLHISGFVLVMKKKTYVHYAFAALLFDYGLMCLIGGIGAIRDHPRSFYYIGTFAFMLLLAPLGSTYIIAFLGSEKAMWLRTPILVMVAAEFAIGTALGIMGLSWHKVMSSAYACVFIILFVVGITIFREIAPIRALPRELKNFFWCYWGVTIQVILLSVFQFFEVKAFVYTLWVLTTLTMLVHSLLVSRNPKIYREYKTQTDDIREGKSRLNGVDVKGRILRLRQVMDKDEFYRESNLQIEDLAAKIGLSGPQLSELLNRHLGKNFAAYINEFRIKEARKALIDSPELSILEICYNCGFASKSSFNAVFRKVTGLTPREFRNKQFRGEL